MRTESLTIFFVLLLSSESDGSRILIYYPTIGISHVMPLQALAKALAARNHQITFLSPFPLSEPIKNYRDIKLKFDDTVSAAFVSQVTKDPNSVSFFQMITQMGKLLFTFGNETLQSREVRRLMREEQYDLVIIGFFFNDFNIGLADHFKCPSIVFGSNAFWTLNQMVGNPISITAVPNLKFGGQMTSFANRLKNVFVTGFEVVLSEYMKYRSKQIYDFNFPSSEGYISYKEAHRNVSLVLINSHYSSGQLRPILPNMVEVGGLQINTKNAKLPEELQTFLDGAAKTGAILFTLGSSAKSTYLPERTLRTILKVFSKLKQRVVMKWESDVLEGKPENVFISTWLPQDDVLAHPNVKLFISHCGLGGTIEAKYHAIPIIGIPLYGDQQVNAENIVKEGWGIKLDIMELSEQSLSDSINEILSNSKYAQIAKRLSDLSRDRPINALETAVYWVEYILRHRGAPHLHYPGADLNFIEYNSLDVIGFLIILLWIIIKVIKFTVIRLCCRRKTSTDKRKKTKTN